MIKLTLPKQKAEIIKYNKEAKAAQEDNIKKKYHESVLKHINDKKGIKIKSSSVEYTLD